MKKRHLFTLFLGLAICACRAKHSETQLHNSDSLSLWQWEQIAFVHERMDSTGQAVLERSTAVLHRGAGASHRQRQDSIARQHSSPSRGLSPAKRGGWSLKAFGWGLGIGAVLALGAYLYLRRRLR